MDLQIFNIESNKTYILVFEEKKNIKSKQKKEELIILLQAKTKYVLK